MTGQSLQLPIPYIGKHVERKHVEEFFGWHREPEEIVVAVIDGIIFDAQGKRVGGMTLHDYLILTDQALILWARGLQSDVMDRLDYSGVSLKTKHIDALHGEVSLTLRPPAVPQATDVRVDLVPLIDLAPFEELFRLSAAFVAKRAEGQSGDAETASMQEIISSAMSGKTRTRQAGGVSSATSSQLRPTGADAPVDVTQRQGASEEGHSPQTRSARSERTLESPFGTGRPLSDSSYSVYRVAQLARDVVTVLPQEIGKNVGLDETLSKLVDRLPKMDSLAQITELINAVNALIVTLSSNPAARAFALQAIDRMVEQGSPLKNILAFARNGFSVSSQRASSAEPSQQGGSSGQSHKGMESSAPIPTKRHAVQVNFGSSAANVSTSPNPGQSPVASSTAEKHAAEPLSLDYVGPIRKNEPELEAVGV